MLSLSKHFWNGFIVNLFAAVTFSFIINYMAYDMLMVFTDRELMITLYLLQYLFWSALIIVFVSGLLFNRWRVLSVWLMSIASLVLLPVGAFLLHGIFRSNNQLRFKQLSALDKKETMKWESITLFNADKILITSAVILGPSLGQVWISGSLVGVVLTSVSSIFLFNALRLNKRPILAWTSETVVITPNLFSDPLLIPPYLIKEMRINKVEMVIELKLDGRSEEIRLKKSQMKNADLGVLEQQFMQFLQRFNPAEVETPQSE